MNNQKIRSAKDFVHSFVRGSCPVTLRRKLIEQSVNFRQCLDDELYTLADGTMVLIRTIVKEWVVFKA